MQLEKTILDMAAQRLKEFKSFSESGTPDDKANSMRDLFSLVELAKIQDSGLTDTAIDELLRIEAEALAISRQSALADADPETVVKNATTKVHLSPGPDQEQL